ncbi:MAG: DUF5062 family protein [Kangiellaceae bacterium]|nr:DUF5062 family protein [Kangiellaceae bacterium]
MKKLKNEVQLAKMAITIGEKYAANRGYKSFSATDSATQKVESLYRLLVLDKLVQPLPKDQENQMNMKHKLAIWISKQLPEGHQLLS